MMLETARPPGFCKFGCMPFWCSEAHLGKLGSEISLLPGVDNLASRIKMDCRSRHLESGLGRWHVPRVFIHYCQSLRLQLQTTRNVGFQCGSLRVLTVEKPQQKRANRNTVAWKGPTLLALNMEEEDTSPLKAERGKETDSCQGLQKEHRPNSNLEFQSTENHHRLLTHRTGR